MLCYFQRYMQCSFFWIKKQKLNIMLQLSRYQLMWVQHPFPHRTKIDRVQLKMERQELWLDSTNWEEWGGIVQIPFSHMIKHGRLNKQIGVNESSDISSTMISFSMAHLTNLIWDDLFVLNFHIQVIYLLSPFTKQNSN